MRLIVGPAGSGKTSLTLEILRQALRCGRQDIRLLVPTATMAQHVQNQLAREGFVFPVRLVDTLSGFVDEWAGEPPQIPPPVLALLVEQASRGLNLPEFASVVQLPGFRASLARTIEELSSAGCDSTRLAGCLPPGPLGAAFLAVYKETDRELERRGLAMRAARLEGAAARLEHDGPGDIRTIWLDGFHALPDPELRVIAALGRRCELTLTLGAGDLTGSLRARLLALGFREERVAATRPRPAMQLMRAPGLEREVEEIARRILDQAAAGRPFREIGIVVRSPGKYVPLLRAALERFSIPARFYFDGRLEEHPAARYLAGVIEAMLSGWDHARTLAALRLAPRFADSRAMDEFDFAVRRQIPNSGLGALKALLVDEEGKPPNEGAERLLHKIDALGALEEWRSFSLVPRDWGARFATLRNLFRPPQFADRIPHEEALLWRGQAAALGLFDQAVAGAAQSLDPQREVELPEFWRCLSAVLRLTPLRFPDRRRNVVHVLPAHEARQWVLPVVFVCGMVEKEFPHTHPQDPFFPEAARSLLNAAGVRVRTAADFEHEERALFEAAISRATMLVTLSYPEFDPRGERNLPSIFLEGLLLQPQDSRPVRPRPRHTPSPLPTPAIQSPRLLDYLRQRSARLSPTRLEIYLQCPFQYFGARTLRLEEPPERPEERLDFMAQGIIVHEALAEWYANPQPMEPLFARIFERVCEERRVPLAYHTERLRNTMLDDLQAFAADRQWDRSGFHSRVEEAFEFALDGSLTISGKIDRIDTAPGGRAYIIDYKYSGVQRTRARRTDENLLQAPLYLLGAEKALGVHPAGMFYVGLKGGVEYVGWSESGILESDPLPEEWLAKTAERTLRVAAEIRAGRVAPDPANPDHCRYCDYRDICRLDVRETAAMAEGA